MPTQLWGGDNSVQQVIDEARQAYSEGHTKQVQLDSSSVTIRTPFPSPVDWREHWIYFLMVDRFNKPNATPNQPPYNQTKREFQGGTIEGVRRQLPYLQQLGAGAIWLTPVHKNCAYPDFDENDPGNKIYPYHGYAIQDFLSIDPHIIAKFDVDGFRIDTLKHLEPEFVRQFCNAMREFAASIGKINFFIFGEIFDTQEELLMSYIGGNSLEQIGVDSVLDFPLANSLTDMMKRGAESPQGIARMFLERKQAQSHIISSHAEAGRYYVTFLDNHDWHYQGQNERFFSNDPYHPVNTEIRTHRLMLAFACLFALQGIPCIYYGTEQGLSGSGKVDGSVREPLWRKQPPAFDKDHQFYKALQQIAAIRHNHPALRYGRQYFRQTSDNGITFSVSDSKENEHSQMAFSRILGDQEIIIIANMRHAAWSGKVLIDKALNANVTQYRVLYSNRGATGNTVNVQEVDGATIHAIDGNDSSTGDVRVLQLDMQSMEVQILEPIKP